MKKSPDCKSSTKKSYLFSRNNLLLLILFTFLVACAEKEVLETSGIFGYVYVPDENFERKLIDLGIDSKGVMDQRILRKDAQAVRTLNIDMPFGTAEENKIRDLVGIEDFKHLKHLSIENNALTYLHLKENKQLGFLKVRGNYLSELNIAYNPNLVELDAGSNQIVTLKGLEKTIGLKVLDLSSNNLSQLDISQLESVSVLDVQHNNSLSCIKIFEEQWIPTMRKEVYQSLNVDSCE